MTKADRVSRQVKPITKATVAITASSDGKRTAQSLNPNRRIEPAISQMASGGLVFHRSGLKS